MTLPTWRDWLFSAKAFLASMLALYIALSFDLPRPYWAMAAVYVVSNPLAGATSSKALYRALGTLIGAAASVILIPLFVDTPELLSFIVALWTGTLLYVSMLDRTPRSYVFMLAGYSLPLIALPTVGAPDTVFDVALARSEEIIIGITCAAIVGSVVFPESVATALSDRVGNWLGSAADWAGQILRGEGAVPRTPLRRQQLAAEVSGLDLIISQLAYDARGRDFVGHAQQLRSRLLILLPTFSSLADRLHALKARDPRMLQRLAPQLDAVSDWLKRGTAAPDEAGRLDAALAQLEPQRDPFSWDNLVFASALARLREVVRLWHDCLNLREQLARGRPAAEWRPALRHRSLVGRARHYDHGLLVFSASVVVVATFAASMFWIYSGWDAGATFVMMCAVAGSFFAGMDRPAQSIVRMFVWSAVSLVVAGVYIFGILPMISGYAMLVVVFAPTFLLIGLLIPRPQTNLLAMLLTVNTASFIALQNQYSADFTAFANGAVAALGGITVALVVTLVMRPFGAELAARRLVRAGWLDLAETASGARNRDQASLSARMLDRLGQLVPRLASVESGDIAAVDGLAEIRVGYNVIELQRQRRRLDEPAAQCIGAVLGDVAALYGQRVAQGRVVAAPDALRLRLDHALRMVSYEGHRRARKACDALVGLRRALFPNAPAPDEHRGESPLPIAAE